MKVLSNKFVISFLLVMSFVTGAISTSAQTASPPTRIDIDKVSGAVRIFSEGREVVTIDASGLQVTGDIGYTGVVTDRGDGGRP